MNQVIQIILSVSVLSIPIVFFWIYMTTLEKRTKKIIQAHSDNSSEIYTDLKVWFKNFDVFKKKNKFDLDPYQTLYSFNNCDLILNDRNIVVIGKTKILGKNKPLTPTFFEFEKNGITLKPGHVKIEKIQEVSNVLEIEFTDRNYLEKMTLVLKRPGNELKEKIKTCYNKS
ncbi:hypothetical protein P700755_003278 [Psychroflexus torquis ATCC 700755]|uniref:Uncharacterized protein n=1 Tax=Psychroflexus torquis (strain ATCC 700755 / CIP 106069 / ACAM 623) TaxID=313595 RepID=K4IWT9_PSYTT|nr:hypothetical protein [Psychroflexus torquis]AFU69925.1 hypothetical protein P700755_003278 [Psychroflexus torquis ATCC 700755]